MPHARNVNPPPPPPETGWQEQIIWARRAAKQVESCTCLSRYDSLRCLGDGRGGLRRRSTRTSTSCGEQSGIRRRRRLTPPYSASGGLHGALAFTGGFSAVLRVAFLERFCGCSSRVLFTGGFCGCSSRVLVTGARHGCLLRVLFTGGFCGCSSRVLFTGGFCGWLFTGACNVSFSTDIRNLKIQFEKAIPGLYIPGVYIRNLALDQLRNLAESEPESASESASESDSGSEFESEESSD